MNNAKPVYIPKWSLSVYPPEHPKLIYHAGVHGNVGRVFKARCGLIILNNNDGRWRMIQVRGDTAETIGYPCKTCWPDR